MLRAICIVLLAAVAAAHTIVGARVVSCSGCRLGQRPQLRSFLRREAGAEKQHPALEVRWVQGASPVLQFLDRHRKPVGEEQHILDRSPADVVALLAAHGLDTAAAPQYVPIDPVPTDGCVAWRQTGGCSPDGEREPFEDEPCTASIPSGRSGFCECADGTRPFHCRHDTITCDLECQRVPDVEPSPDSADDSF